MAHHGHEVAVSPDLDAQNTEAILGIVERDPLDETGQRLAFGVRRVGAEGRASGSNSHEESLAARAWNGKRTFSW
jgi:hypothetical protein